MMSNHFKIIIPLYNAHHWIRFCVKSVKEQDYDNFQCIILDDLSTDKSAEIIKDEIKDDERFVLIENTEKAFALKNIYDGICASTPQPEDIILTLDGDDWLPNAGVLKTLNDIYNTSNCWLTYGSYAEFPSGLPGPFAKQIAPHVIKSNSFREEEWCASHLRTFKHHLWSQIKKEDLLDDQGLFYEMAWDLAFMFPMLEMAGEKSKYVSDILYIYNLTNPLNDHKVNHQLQLSTEQKIRKKQKYERL
tara:strand:- start:543 stop:1283 length:741 start_codon:yes stop_codon:yes gene_type:complete